MSAESRPAWARKYLSYAAWTQDELRNLLCGLKPNPPNDAPVLGDSPLPTRQEINDSFVRDELRRVEADRHIRDAISAGYLRVLKPADDQILAKAAGALTPDEVAILQRALAHERACSKSYVVTPEAAVRWAANRADLFPDFPFGSEDLRPRGTTALPDETPLTPKERRARLVDLALRHRSTTKAEFCRANADVGLTVDILRAVVNADGRRADLDRWTPTVLNLLGISAESWEDR